jgi:N-acetyl-anhydromuramyl-L-alanine amidase AmpD
MFQDPVIIQKKTPNMGVGRFGRTPIAVVIHITQGPTLKSTEWSFSSPSSETSANYVVGRDEIRIEQYVDEKDRAWHAGLSGEILKDPKQRPIWKLWQPGLSPNVTTIGIENVGFSVDIKYGKTQYKKTGPFTDWQYFANAWLVARAARRWGFPINEDTVVRHGDIYLPKRTTCPGPAVDMARIIREAIELSKV